MTHSPKLLIGWLAALLVIAGIVYAAYDLFATYSVNERQAQQPGVPTPNYLVPLLNAKVVGDSQSALDAYQSIQNNPQSTDEQKALAEISIAGVQYNLTGSTTALLGDVQNMRSIITDLTVSTSTRAIAMNILGTEYAASGGNSSVFEAVFTGTPFSTYLSSGSAALSDMKLEEASYALSPISSAAMDVSAIASAQYFQNPSQSASTTAADAAIAEDYLQKGNAAMASEAQSNANFSISDRYLEDRSWAAITVGQLAIEVGQPYEGMYREQFSDLISFLQSQQSKLASYLALSARYNYAHILGADKDTADEKAQLDLLAQQLNALSNPTTNSFAVSLINAHTTRTPSKATQAMMAVSPDFKTAVTKLIASSNK
jgi:hypothetical protein